MQTLETESGYQTDIKIKQLKFDNNLQKER